MLYKNKIKGQNILKSAVALMLMLTLSLSTALSPLAKAEEAKYTWKTLTTVPVTNDLGNIYTSPDGSKLFIFEEYDSHSSTNLWMSADDGATWRKIWSEQTTIEYASFNMDGSKIVLEDSGSSHFYRSTDGGQSWVANYSMAAAIFSPDGSFLVGCSVSGGAYTTYISTNDGRHQWTQKGTNSVGCPTYVANNGTLIAQSNGNTAKSTDYGQTWTEISNVLNHDRPQSFSNNGNNIFEGDRISLDGGNHWTPSNAPTPAGYTFYQTGISDDGKKLFTTVKSIANIREARLLTSVDGGRTWDSEDLSSNDAAMSNDGSKLFNVYIENGRFVYRVGTLPAAQPVTPGSGAGGAATPSTGSTSATPGQKPGKASGRLAETGISVQLISGLAVVAVAAGALVLRKRL